MEHYDRSTAEFKATFIYNWLVPYSPTSEFEVSL